MKSVRHVIMVLTLAAVAIGISAPPAAAQVALKGTFTLPVEVYWGAAVLPAGEYAISMNLNAATSARLVFLDGQGVHAMILAGLDTPGKVSNHNALQLEQTNGVYVVRRLDAGVVGQSYSFLVSGGAHKKMEQAGLSTPLTVPITASAGN